VIHGLVGDLRHAARGLVRRPGFAALAVASLALGIGANAVLFTWMKAVFLEPLPGVRDVSRLVAVQTTTRTEGVISISWPDFVDIRDRTQDVFSGLAVTRIDPVALGHAGGTDRVWSSLVSGDYFAVLGVRPELGRLLGPQDDRTPGDDPVVVLSHALWQRLFAGDAEIVGKSVLVNARPFTVVGVAPPAFRGSDLGLAFDLWLPVAMHEVVEPGGPRFAERGNHWLTGLARLKPGVDLDQARARLAVVARQLEQEYPSSKGNGLAAWPFAESPRGGGRILRPILLVLAAVSGLVLLIACANVANLLLVRATSRRHEVAVRLSVGASRGQLVRQFLVEAILLSFLGGAAGLVLALWGKGLLLSFVPKTPFPVFLDTTVDGRVLAFALALSLVTGALAGLAPALQASRRDVVGSLREETAPLVSGRRGGHVRRLLVAAQVALSLVLLVGAGLLTRSLQHAADVDVGFDPHDVLLASVDLFTAGFDRARGEAAIDQALERLRALPGVESVTVARHVPLSLGGGTNSSSIEVEGFVAKESEPAWGYINFVGPDYFRTLGAMLVAGRDISKQDRQGAPEAAVVNETMARRYWPGRDALGRRFRLGSHWLQVVGVVHDMKFRGLKEPEAPMFFLPVSQWYRPDVTFHVRAASDPTLLAGPVREALLGLDPNLAPFGLRTLEETAAAASFQQRVGSHLLGILGAVGLALAGVGLYGVLSFLVAQRTREIGLRMALGGSPRDVLGLVMRQGMALAGVGIVVGLVAGLALARPLASLLVGISPGDPVTFVAVPVVLAAVALLACWAPARRAMRVRPIEALRYE
jgi:macrolide transport system ATP-binding/permease protein